jgi:hypothetical protein
LRASVRPTRCNLAGDNARFGHIARRAQTILRNLLRSKTPE